MRRYFFWICVVVFVGILAAFTIVFALPVHRSLAASISHLTTGGNTLETILKERVASRSMIGQAEQTLKKLNDQHANIVKYFEKDSNETVNYWPEVLREGKLERALFQYRYPAETKALLNRLREKMEVDEGALTWKTFGAEVPTEEDCELAMIEFRLLGHVSGLVLASGTVRRLVSVKIEDNETLVQVVKGVNFYARFFEIKAAVAYPKLSTLITQLEKSDRHIFVDSISIDQTDSSAIKEVEEPPVLVTLQGIMMRGKKSES